MPGSSTTPGWAAARTNALVHVAFRVSDHVGARYIESFAAPWLAYVLPYRRFDTALAVCVARLGVDAVCYSFIVADFHPLLLAGFAGAPEIRQFNTAWTNIHEAMTAVETTKENWYEAEINRVAGEIALLPPEPDATKAEAYFARALEVARQQQAKSWELRAAMSMARLWRDRGRRDEARDLLAPVYGWFTEGFDTLHLREAKALLDALES